MNSNTTRRLEVLAAIDQLRLAAAVAAPALEELLQEAEAAGVSRHRIATAIGVPYYVGRWAIQQRRLIEQGSEHQQASLEVAEQLLLEGVVPVAPEVDETGATEPDWTNAGGQLATAIA